MAGFRICPECEGESYSQHQINAAARSTASTVSDASSSDGAAGEHASSPATQRLLARAGAIFDAIDALIGYRVHQPFTRYRNERVKVTDLTQTLLRRVRRFRA